MSALPSPRLLPALILGSLLLSSTANAADPCAPKTGTVPDLQTAVATGGTTVDPSALFKNGPNPTALAAVLRGIADEPGEKGFLGLKVGAGGKIGTGVVNGAVEGEIALQVNYSMTDQNQVVLGMDLAAALQAGINVAGLAEFGGKVEVSGDIVMVSFADSQSAATWLTGQLNGINKRTGNRLWPAASTTTSQVQPLSVSAVSIAAGAYAQAGVGDLQIKGEAKVKKDLTHYVGVIDNQKVDITQVTNHVIGQASLDVPFRSDTVQVAYSYDWNTDRNSPYYAMNGEGVDHRISLKIPVVAGSKTLSETPGAPSKELQDFILNAFSKIEKVAPGGTLKGLNYGAFTKAVESAYDSASKSNKLNAKTYLTVEIQITNGKESDGTWVPVLQRVYVGGEQHFGAEFDVKAVKVEVDGYTGKTELVYEHLGTQTGSYFQQQYLYQTSDRPWSTFKSDNASALSEYVKNVATPGTAVYDSTVASAYASGGYSAGMKAIEQKWSSDNARIASARQDATALAQVTNQWQWWNGADNMANEMSGILEKYPCQAERQYLYDLVDDYGGNPQVIQDLASRSTSAGQRLRAQTGKLDTSASK